MIDNGVAVYGQHEEISLETSFYKVENDVTTSGALKNNLWNPQKLCAVTVFMRDITLGAFILLLLTLINQNSAKDMEVNALKVVAQHWAGRHDGNVLNLWR